MMYKSRSMSGMSLLEILLYVSISGAILLAASGVLSTVYEAKQKGRIIQTVEEEGAIISLAIDSYIKSTRQVLSPEMYRQGDLLNMIVTTETKDILVQISSADGSAYAVIDNGPKLALSSSAVTVSGLMFETSGASTKGFVSYRFSVESADQSGRNSYRKDFIGGASIR